MSKSILSTLVALLLAAALCTTLPLQPPHASSPKASPRYLGFFPNLGAAFTHIQPLSAAEPERLALFIQAFPLNLPSSISVVPDIAKYLTRVSEIKPQLVTDQIVWPNGATTAGNGTLLNGPRLGMVVASGFIPPPVATGGVHYIDLDSFPTTGNVRTYKLTRDKFQYFYHRAFWVDCDGDGIQDLMTARARTSGPDGELVCLIQPKTSPLTNIPWKEILVSKSPDVHFEVSDIQKNGQQHVASSTFFSDKVELVLKKGNLWSETTKIERVVIDTTAGNPFDVVVADLNNDGKNELLVSNHENIPEKTALYAYEIPDQLENVAGYKRRLLGGGFPVTTPGDNQASPGAPKVFYPNTRQTSGKPWILLTGDAAQEAYLFTPKSESPSDWSYDYYPILNTGGTTGEMSVYDVDGDGWVEVFLPDFDNGNIHVFTFAP